jgi:glycine dehydrogenase subunit 1
MPYIPNSDEEVRQMLAVIGVRTVDDLFKDIPRELRIKKRPRLPAPATELKLQREAADAANRCETFDRMNAFLGGGVYDHFIPAVVQHLAHRVETVTSYTPYQPEASQGNLTFMFEYQSAICELTGMEVSNASMYEGASACAEAALMAPSTRSTGRSRGPTSATSPASRSSRSPRAAAPPTWRPSRPPRTSARRRSSCRCRTSSASWTTARRSRRR